MMRFAKEKDILQVRALWEQCFPDESGFNAYFFAKRYKPEGTLLYERDGELLAMLQMMDRTLQIGDTTKPVTYIYGACTAPHARCKGYMAELLQWSFQLDQQLQKTASILIPQEEWLFQFYAKFGYQPAFFVKSEIIQQEGDMADIATCTMRIAQQKDLLTLHAFYQKVLSGQSFWVFRSQAEWEEQKALFQALGGNLYLFEEQGKLIGYAFIWHTESSVQVQELLTKDTSSRSRCLQVLAQHFGVEALSVTEPFGQTPFGMYKSYGDIPKGSGYLNLMWN